MRTRWYSIARTLVRWYPASWRDRYGDELLDVLEQHDVTARTVRNLLLHAAIARVQPRLSREGTFVMPRLRPRLVALVTAFPLFLIAFAGWIVAADPLNRLTPAIAGERMPLWSLSAVVINMCSTIVVPALILGALVVALLRARGSGPWTAAGHLVAAAVAVIGLIAYIVILTGQRHPLPIQTKIHFFQALELGIVVAITILTNAAARARSEPRTARIVVIPAVMFAVVLLVTFVAMAWFAAGFVVNGVPVWPDVAPGTGHIVYTYRIEDLPAAQSGWLTALIISLVASLGAFVGAVYAVVGALRGAQIRAVTADL
jgi:hypothetical protein